MQDYTRIQIYVILKFSFDFGEGVTITDCLGKRKIYVSEIVESYKDTIIGFLGNTGTTDL